MSKSLRYSLAFFMALLLAAPCGLRAQEASGGQGLKPEQLEQLLAPIALYPDSLLTQVLMASTYPLEIVQADRWAKQNKDMKGDALAKALEAQPWDPSVKSLVNFPEVLSMMSEKLDWTQKLGDAFLAQQKDVMDSVQRLRKQAYDAGNLKSSEQQKIIVEQAPQQTVIVVEPANPQVIYVPAYNPTVVYGTWAYPAYPPYPVYPPGYVATTAAFSFMAGAAVGAAWGYAWGHSNWHGGDVDIDVNRNTNINTNINRQKYASQYQGQGKAGQGQWQHDASHRGGVAYRDQATAQKYNRGQSANAQARESYRGRSDTGRQELARGGADQPGERPTAGTRDAQGQRGSGSLDRGSAQQPRESRSDRGTSVQSSDRSAFGGYERGSQARDSSSRGRESMSSARSGGFQGGGGRGGGGRGGGRGR
jgi:uncharacterized membrane protein YgcG